MNDFIEQMIFRVWVFDPFLRFLLVLGSNYSELSMYPVGALRDHKPLSGVSIDYSVIIFQDLGGNHL